MAFALVGTAGTAVQTAAGGAASPTFGTGESRTAGNLLLAFVTVTGVATLPTTPSGWTIGRQVAGTSCSATVYYKVAVGADAAPVISAITSGLIAAHLEEWSGGTTVDEVGSATGTSSPITATLSAADAGVGGLVAMAGADRRSTARASNDTWTSNNGTPVLRASNNGTSSVDHYSHATLVTTSAAAADTAIMTLSITTSITGLAVAAISFTSVKTITLGLLNASNQMYAPTLSIVPTATKYQQLVVSDGPVGYWKLDEASGVPIDSSGNGRPGYTTGVVTQGVAGSPDGNNAVTIAGAGTVSVIPTGSLALTTPFTIECWVKLTNGTASIGSFGDYLWGKGSDQVPNLWIAAGSNLGKIAMSRSDQADVIMTTAAPTWGTTWHHVVATYVHTTEAKIYFDGVALATGAPNYGSGFGTNAMDFAIGSKWAGGGGTDALHGTIDEVAIYQRALSAAEIVEHWAIGQSVTDYQAIVIADAPVAYYKLDEASGTIVDAMVGNNGTLSGTGTTYGAAGPGYTNTGLTFNRSGWVAIPDSADLDVTTPFSLEVWAKHASGSIDFFGEAPMGKGGTGAPYIHVAGGNAAPEGRVRLFKGDTGQVVASTTTPFAGNTSWHHIVATYQHSTVAKIYIDGVDVSGTPSYLGFIATADQAGIGNRQGSGAYEPWGGTVDEVAWYNRVLSAAEVLEHFEAGAPPAAAVIALGLLTSTSALYAPMVTTDSYLTLGLLTSTSALYAPTVIPDQSLALPLLSTIPDLFAPDLVQATTTVDVTLGLIDGVATLYSPSLAAKWSVSLGLLDAGPALYAPAVLQQQYLTLGLLTSTSLLYGPTLSVGPVSVSTPLIDAGPALYGPTLVPIAPAAGTITLGLLDAVPALFPPTTFLDQFVVTPLIDAVPALFAPTVQGAPVGVTVPLLTSVAAVYSPTVAVMPVTVTLPQLVSVSVLYSPLISGGGSVTLSLTLLDSPALLYAPSVATRNLLTLPLLTSLAVQYNLSVVAAPAGVALSLLDAGRAVYSPQLSAINPLTLPHLSSVAILYPPSVDDDIYVWTPLLSTIPDLYAPSLFSAASEEGERLAYNITKQEFWPTKPYNPHVYPLRKK